MTHFFCEDLKFNLPQKRLHKTWIKQIADSEHRTLGDLNIIFCSDSYLLELNQKYLSHETFTDIITFDYGEDSKISGDIFISIERITENAAVFKVNFEDELLRVMAHGVLHLCGYKDKQKTDKTVMTDKENDSIKMFKSLK